MKAAACLRRAWRAGAEPSLIRRLVLAQAVVLVVVWIALGALLMVEFQSDASELDPLRHDAVLAVGGAIGRAWCGERGEISGGAVSFKKKKTKMKTADAGCTAWMSE